jgi:hypothetical protein
MTAAYLIDARTGEEVRYFTGRAVDGFGLSVALAESTAAIAAPAANGFSGEVIMYDVNNGAEIARIAHGERSQFPLFGGKVATTDEIVVVGSPFDGTVYVVDIATGKLVQRIGVDNVPIDGLGIAVDVDDYNIVYGGNFSAHYLELARKQLNAIALGDFNNDQELDTEDIDLLTRASLNDPDDAFFDVDGDSVVGRIDRQVWIENLKGSSFGDANLDGEFNSDDLVSVFIAGEYEDAIAENSGWAEGDWDGDGDCGTGDLVLAFQDGGYEQGPRTGVAAVPEPSNPVLLMIVAWLSVPRTRRRTLALTPPIRS